MPWFVVSVFTGAPREGVNEIIAICEVMDASA
jgi:hypothetical protein